MKVDFGRFVEIVGVIGIITSLAFLGYEVKRSNDIAEAEAIAKIYSMTNRMGLTVAADPKMSRVLATAQSDFAALSQEELWSLYLLVDTVINSTETAWTFYDKGIIDAEEADYFAQGLCRLIDLHPTMQAAWRENRENRIPGFYDYVTRVCEE